MKNVVVAGATGLVGSAVVRLLERREDVTVHALVRKAGSLAGSRRREIVFDYHKDADTLGGEIPCDVLLSCLGTTIAKAGSQKAFRAVDHELPAILVARLKELPQRPGVALVSSVGASSSGNFYLRTKFETEELVRQSGLPYLIVRPSVLLGDRHETRFVERAAIQMMRPLFAALIAVTGRSSATIGRLRPITDEQVAQALIHHAVDTLPPNKTLEGWDLFPS